MVVLQAETAGTGLDDGPAGSPGQVVAHGATAVSTCLQCPGDGRDTARDGLLRSGSGLGIRAIRHVAGRSGGTDVLLVSYVPDVTRGGAGFSTRVCASGED